MIITPTQKELEKQIKELVNKLEFHELFNEYSNIWETFRNESGKLIYLSNSFEWITGYKKIEYLKGKIDFFDLVIPEDRENAEINYKKQINRENINNFECRIKDKKKSIKYLSISSKPVYSKNDEYLGFRTTCIDVTDAKQVEQALKESENKLLNITEKIPTLICHVGKDLIFLYANKNYLDFYQLTNNDLIGESVEAIFGKVRFKKILPDILRVLKGEEINFEKEFKKDDSTTVILEIKFVPQKTNENVDGYFVLMQDITINKQVESSIKSSEEKFKLLNNLISEMLELQNLESIYNYITNFLQSRYPNTVVLFNSVDENLNETTFETVSGLSNNLISEIIKISGYNLIGKKFKVVQQHRNYFKSGKFVEFNGNLSQFAASELPEFVTKSIEMLIQLHKIYTIGITKDEDLLASVHFFTYNNQSIDDSSFIEAFVKQAGIVIQKKIAEQALKKNEEKLTAIFSLLPAIISIVDKNGKIIYNSGTFNNLLKYNIKDRVGENIITSDLIHPIDRERIENNFLKNLQNPDQIIETEYRGLTAEHGYIWFKAISKNYMNNPAISGILVVVQEITEMKKNELALKESEEKYFRLIQMHSEGLGILNRQFEFELINPAIENIFEVFNNKLIGKSIYIFIENIDIARIFRESNSNLKRKQNTIELIIKTTTGVEKNVLITSTPIFDNNIFTGTFCVFRDITHHKNTEKALKESQNRLKKIIETIPDLIFHFDNNGKFLSFYQENTKKLFKHPNDFINKSIYDVFEEKFADKIKFAINQTLIFGFYEYSYELFDNQLNYFHAKFAKLNENEVVVTARDITEQKLSELQLQKNTTELKELNATKDKLFSIIAHDLRSPFSGILGISELLSSNIKEYEINKTQNLIEDISNQAKNTLTLLDNLLNWANSQTNKIQFRPTKNILKNLIEEITDVLSSFAKTKNISIKYFQIFEIEVYADQNMLKTVLRNLISNAIKFTNIDGQIEILGEDYLHFNKISVKDSGIGIDEKTQKQLFKLDNNTKTVGTANEKGSGLGLILCKEFIEKHNGKIWVESKLGEGSKFIFTLPKT